MQRMHATPGDVVTAFFEVYNTKRYEDLRSCMAATYFDHTLAYVRSLEDAIEVLASIHCSFPDLHVDIDDLISEGELVVFRGRFTGTHLGDFAGVGATGRRVEFEAIEIFKVKDGRIAESWGYWPSHDILRQLQQLIA